jgi:hypothetical protein
MRLSILLVTQPVRVARLLALAGLAALAGAALSVGGSSMGRPASAVALLATGVALGALAPLYGRTAAAGLWGARAGIVLGAIALLLPDVDEAVSVRSLAAMVVVIGLQPVARRTGERTDLPSWATHVVGAAVAVALLAPSLGGGVALTFAWLAVAVAIRTRSAAPVAAARA